MTVTVIEPGGDETPQPATGSTDFAAGVAAATATQAAEEAQEAVEQAERAEETAEAALEAAGRAEGEAWDARSAIADLDYKITSRLDAIEERLTPKEEGDGGPPAPEPKSEASEEPAKEEEPAAEPERGYGHRRWFGH